MSSYTLVRNIVYNTHPRHLSVDIPIDTKIQVILRVDLDVIGFFKKENILLTDTKQALNIPIDVQYNNRKITITPMEPLNQNSHYIIEMLGGETGVETITGAHLEESWFMEFYTGVDETIKAPKIAAPTDQTITKNPVTFKWEQGEDVFYYHLQISESNTFNHIIWPPLPDINVFDGEATPQVDYKEKNYYARIKAFSITGKESAWSDTVQFYVQKAEEIVDDEPLESHDPAYYLEARSSIVGGQLEALKDALSEEVEKNTGLKVKSISIKNGMYNLPLESMREINIEFDQPIDKNSINAQTVYLIGERN